MIHQEELSSYIEKNIPEISGLCKKNNCHNVYDIVKQMLSYTTQQIAAQNIKAAKQCMTHAARLYEKGNGVIKNAIENVFVFSFSHAFFYDESKRAEIVRIIPAPLYKLYKKQVVNSHL